MFNIIKYTVFLSIILFFSSCSSNNGSYVVIFENNPELTSSKIYSKNFVIGNVLSQKLNSNNLVIVSISIDNEFRSLIKENTVFYINNGIMIYDTIGNDGSIRNSGSKILGFNSKALLYLYITKNKIKNYSKRLIEEAEKLYSKALENIEQ